MTAVARLPDQDRQRHRSVEGRGAGKIVVASNLLHQGGGATRVYGHATPIAGILPLAPAATPERLGTPDRAGEAVLTWLPALSGVAPPIPTWDKRGEYRRRVGTGGRSKSLHW